MRRPGTAHDGLPVTTDGNHPGGGSGESSRDGSGGHRSSGRGLTPLYAGGFLGPFGGSVVHTMLPELAEGLNTSLATAATAITWYSVPFAAIMVFSGTLGGRWGPARTVRWAFIAYAVTSLVCAAVTAALPFLASRAVMGLANGFMTPLMVAMLAERVPSAALGSTLGRYAAMQASGMAFAPLVGGAAAGVDYRLAFVASALAGIVLALSIEVPPDAGPRRRGVSRQVRPGEAARADAGPPAPPVPGLASIGRLLLNLQLATACLIACCSQFCGTGLNLLAALVSSDRFGVPPHGRGLVVAAFGLAGLTAGPAFGRWADRVGLRTMGTTAMVLLALAMASSTTSPWLAGVVAATALGGAASTAGRILTNSLAVGSTPDNRAGATSLMMSLQFLGSALAPTLVAVYHRDATAAGLAAAVVALAGTGLALSTRPARH